MDGSASLTPAGLAATLFLGLLLLALPRRYAVLPLLAGGAYLPLGQAWMVAGLHFYVIRILVLVALVRVVGRREIFQVTPTRIDLVWFSWLLVSCFLFVAADGTHVRLTERLGDFYTACGIFVLVRSSLRTRDECLTTVRGAALLILPIGVLFAVERATGENLFSVLGGVPLQSVVRNGLVRCQGPFQHPILAGTFGATSVPLFVGMWAASPRDRLLGASAAGSAMLIVMTSASSGPLSAFFVVVLGLACWPLRAHMRLVRWSLLLAVAALAMVMKAPVWFIIDRLSEVVGGDGWYRSALIDSAVRHVNEWWLVGTGDTAHWMATGIRSNPYSADIVNEFVNQGIRGGLLGLGLFAFLIALCFKQIGMVTATASRAQTERYFPWAIGCCLLGHIASFFSVSYFDQIVIFWYLMIGMCAAAHSELAAPKPTVAKAAGLRPFRLVGAPLATVRRASPSFRFPRPQIRRYERRTTASVGALDRFGPCRCPPH